MKSDKKQEEQLPTKETEIVATLENTALIFKLVTSGLVKYPMDPFLVVDISSWVSALMSFSKV